MSDNETKTVTPTEPPDLFSFVSLEHNNFLVSIVNFREENIYFQRFQGLLSAAISNKTADDNNFLIFQLLSFIHYHSLYSTSSYFRGHPAEAFISARAAIDAALIASHIIHDRPSQTDYLDRKKPFDKLVRHYRNFVRDGKKMPNRFIERLINEYDNYSQCSGHADINTFTHRVSFVDEHKGRMIVFNYFQIPENNDTRRMYFLRILLTFTMCLDVFTNFLKDEVSAVPELWAKELSALGAVLEHNVKELQLKLNE